MKTSVPTIPRQTVVQAPRPAAQFLRPDKSGFISGWPRPALREASADVRQAWGAVASRAVETIQNSGWMTGAVDQAISDTLGTGLKLNANPDWEVCGFKSEEAASEWARKAEKRFRSWSRKPLECDARGKMTISQMADAALRSHYAFGESTARILTRRRRFATTETKVQLFSPLRLVQETREEARLHQGVFLDADGLPIGYRLRVRKDGAEETINLPARDRDGRALIVHIFDGAADQTRGISPFAPILKVFRQADQLADATLVAALMQTIFAATVKSDGLSDEVFDGMTVPGEGGQPDLTGLEAFLGVKEQFWSGNRIDLSQHGRINHLFFGEELEFHNSNHPHNNYLPFMRNLLREIARAIGVSYEAMAFDYENATYSSVRMGIASLWPLVVRRRQFVSSPFYQAVYDAWMEEQVFKGWLPFPGGYQAFLKVRTAATQAEWNGPAKPTADDLKSAKSMGERLERGVSNLAIECADLGFDWEDIADQRARESAYYQQRGLPDPHAAKGSPLVGHNGGPPMDDAVEEDADTGDETQQEDV
ncbi:phage portal protein [Roseibium suaedae]|uniref:Phage portal protein, lambda family n=1 Tax=Roseibium suaedae TaxID=735517 RepID=A0A1M7D8F9_9HYPH|nr:phage portal protein [Roseibium suaedae]SHL75811.1 phage portal protein, lambda family [Roseibium suaedae]